MKLEQFKKELGKDFEEEYNRFDIWFEIEELAYKIYHKIIYIKRWLIDLILK